MWFLRRVPEALLLLAAVLAAPHAAADSAHLVKDINPSAGSLPQSLVDLNGILLFAADDGTHGSELWRSDGTAAGTYMVADIYPGANGSTPGPFVVWNNALYFEAFEPTSGTELWRSDGTAAGTTLVKDIWPGAGASSPSDFAPAFGALFFAADDGVHGSELWKTDGTGTGTVFVADINPGSAGSGPFSLSVVGSTLLFTAEQSGLGRELWKSDGSASGTQLVRDIDPGSSGGAVGSHLLVLGSPPVAYFTAQTAASGTELWRSDGTTAGTSLVIDLIPGATGGAPSQILAPISATTFLLIGATPGTGFELFRSDGTAGGTILVKDLNPGSGDSFPNFLGQLSGKRVFFANNGVTGAEPWTTDGTPAGTTLLLDVDPGSSGSPFLPFFTNGEGGNGLIYFGANDGATGAEPWRTDGTTAGTFRVRDVTPGAGGSQPQDLVRSGSLVYFTADDGQTGRELWAIPINAAVDSDGDGLSDEREDLGVGTSSAIPDTDGDGLLDGAEVLTYGTNPLDPDSDGDGYSDGVEIAAGSNPLDRNSVPHPVPVLPQPGAIALVVALAAVAARELARRERARAPD